MAAKISDVLRSEGHPGYAIDVAALECLVVKLRKVHEAAKLHTLDHENCGCGLCKALDDFNRK